MRKEKQRGGKHFQFLCFRLLRFFVFSFFAFLAEIVVAPYANTPMKFICTSTSTERVRGYKS